MADSLFDDKTNNQPHFDEEKDYLAELTGPGGKYDRTKYASDLEMHKAIAKGKVHADRTLDFTLKEKDELRNTLVNKTAEADAAAKFEEMFNKHLDGLNKEPAKKPDAGDVEQPTFDPKKVDEQIESKWREIQIRNQEANNLNEFEKVLKERFSDSAGNILRERMNTMGLTADDVKSLAKKSPQAILNALGLNKQEAETYQAPPRSSVRSDNFSPTGSQKRTASYWDKLKKADPKKYFSPELSTQRMKDIDDLGLEFDDLSRRPHS